jgi:peptidoglycan/LPS O-acetylase OafA/YrhL
MKRIKELDSIRGLAALVIVFYHLWFQNIGILGAAVDLFFVLSGYLITTIILANTFSERFLFSFYMRRGLRIWPIYYLTLVAMVLIYAYLPPCGNLNDLPYYLTFTQEVVHYRPSMEPSFPSAFRHTWSLAIEEQFYLIWPPLVWWLGSKRLPIASMLLVVVAVFARALDFSAFLLITHCDGLALGGLLAGILAAHEGSATGSRKYRLGMGILGVVSTVATIAVIALPGCLNSQWPGLVPDVLVRVIKPLCLNLVFFAVVGNVVNYAGLPSLGWLRDSRLVYLGSISYGIYLYHHIIFEIFAYYARFYGWNDSVVIDFGKVALSIALAALSWRFVEQPILAFKDRFSYREATRAVLEIGGAVDDIRGVQAG